MKSTKGSVDLLPSDIIEYRIKCEELSMFISTGLMKYAGDNGEHKCALAKLTTSGFETFDHRKWLLLGSTVPFHQRRVFRRDERKCGVLLFSLLIL